MISQFRSTQKVSGGKYHDFRKKRLADKASGASLTKVDARHKVKAVKTLGGNTKGRVLVAAVANVLDRKTGKHQKAKIKAVLENSANRNYVRRNIVNLGAVIDTELGKAKVTSRPAQDGTVNAVLL